MNDEQLKITRPSIYPLDEWVDGFMMGLGLATYDLADEATRVKLRIYVRSQMRMCLNMSLRDLKRGAERGMEQAMQFMFDPKRSDTVKKRRKEKAERHAQMQAESKRKRQEKEIEKLGRIQ